MKRLTELDENGNIRVKAFNIENVKSGNWKVMNNEMYELQKRLYAYEETGLSPEQIKKLNEFERSQLVTILKELAAERAKYHWILPEMELPESGDSVLVTVSGHFGGMIFQDALELAVYDPVVGWIVDGYPEWEEPEVKAWMHLPEAYGSDVEQSGIFEAEGVDATKEAVYPEWKRKLMQTFLGSRRGRMKNEAAV